MPSQGHFDLAIAGAGVMGLSCAWEAARRGRSVLVFDPETTSAQASWAAAGILVTRDARAFHSAFREFYVRSIRMYPEWLETLRSVSGKDVPHRRGGDWMAFDLDDARAVKRMDEKRRQFEREKASAFTESDGVPPPLAGLCRVERVRSFHFPGEAYVQNRILVEALRAACGKAGVVFRSEAAFGRWEYAGGTTCLRFPGGEVEARQVLIAAGAWSARILAEQGIEAPMVPVKGQLLRMAKFHASDSMVHLNDELYLVPRGDSLVAGATTEPGNWSEEVDGIGEAFVEDRLRHWLPGLSVSPLERWSGIRPRSRDRLPWMGWLDAPRGWAICAGHYKTGISMAPLASLCIGRMLAKEKPPADLAPFDPWRKQGLARL